MKNILVIADTTFKESIRSKILYSIFFFLALVVAVSSLLGSVTIGDKLSVMKSFGIAAISLFSIGYVVVAGSVLLHKELIKKTIHNILSKPVKRWEFVAGKFLGMLGTASLVSILMILSLLVFLLIVGGKFESALLFGGIFIVFELLILCAAALFFSSIVVTPMLTGLFATGIFLAGRSSSYIKQFSESDGLGGGAKHILEVLYWGIPHLDSLYIGDKVTYGFIPSVSECLWAAMYSLGYAGMLLSVASLLFQRKEFQ